MNKWIFSLLLCSSLLLFSTLLLAKEKPSIQISPGVYKKLKAVENLVVKKLYSDALNKLQNIHASVDQGSYSEVLVLRTMANTYVQTNQYNKAIKALKKCLALKIAPDDQQQEMILNLAQLYMTTNKSAKAIKLLEPWLQQNPNQDANTRFMIASAYAQLQQYTKALPFINKTITATKKPVESWYQLKLALHFGLEQYSESVSILRKLLKNFPDKKQYWIQLASVYQHLGQYKNAVTITHLAYKRQIITTEKGILNLVNLYLSVGTPFKAAKIMTEEIKSGRISHTSKNWGLLANAWTQAQEFNSAIAALTTASTLHDKGSLHQQLGRIYIEQEKWSEAIKAFNQAIAKGGIKQQGETYILLGMSHYELDQPQLAKSTFLKAQKHPKTRETALQWLDYLDHSTAN